MFDQFAQFCAVALHLERKHRGAGNFEGEKLHRRKQVDRGIAGHFEVGNHGGRGTRDMARQDRHRARRKGWRQGATLVPPILAGAQQQTLAQQRAQDADAGRGATVISRIVDQDMLDARGPAYDDQLAAKEFAEDDILLEGLGRKRI